MTGLFEQLCFNDKKDYFEEIEDWQKVSPDQKLYIWGTGNLASGVARQL